MALHSTATAHHRTAREEHGDKSKSNYRTRSPLRQPREKLESADGRKQSKFYSLSDFKVYVNPHLVKKKKNFLF